MRSFSSLFFSFVLFAGSFGCGSVLARHEPERRPTAAFDRLWRDFHDYYGLFAVKGIDWDAAYATYRPRVNDSMSDAELYEVVTTMLAELDDKHVSLYPATNPELPTFSVDLVDGAFPEPPFDPDVVRGRYLTGARFVHPNVEIGMLAGRVGYVHVSSFDGNVDDYDSAFDEAFRAFEGAAGVVVDVRDNAGGFDPLAQRVASRFASERRLYMTARKRNGTALDDFTDPVAWYVEPSARSRFQGPTVLLTTYATQSAAETFSLAMRTIDGVTHVGETTAGAFSDNILRETSNGWAYTISVGDYRAADGLSYEGVGLAPDIVVTNTYDDVRAGRDPVLEQAITVFAQ